MLQANNSICLSGQSRLIYDDVFISSPYDTYYNCDLMFYIGRAENSRVCMAEIDSNLRLQALQSANIVKALIVDW